MVPADHLLALVLGVHLLVDVLPSRVRERQLRALLFGMKRVDGRLDLQIGTSVVLEDLADEHAADLAARIARATFDRAVERLFGRGTRGTADLDGRRAFSLRARRPRSHGYRVSSFLPHDSAKRAENTCSISVEQPGLLTFQPLTSDDHVEQRQA